MLESKEGFNQNISIYNKESDTFKDTIWLIKSKSLYNQCFT